MVQASRRRDSGMLEKATYEDKRYLLDALDVQVKLCRREGGRWLYVTCGIIAESATFKLSDAKGASLSAEPEPQPQSSFVLRSC